LENLVRLVNELPAADFPAQVGPHLDLNAFVRYVAAQNFMAQNDGFLGYAGMNNFYFYRLENSSTHVLLAWDEDNAFDTAEFPIHHRHDENVLMRKTMQLPEWRAAYYDTLRNAIASASEPVGEANTPWLEHEVRRQFDLIDEAIRADTLKPYSNEDHDVHRAHLINFAQARAANVQQQITVAAASSDHH
jgi:hypothetical protein